MKSNCKIIKEKFSSKTNFACHAAKHQVLYLKQNIYVGNTNKHVGYMTPNTTLILLIYT